MVTIVYNKKKCIGCNSCVLVCPLFFVMSKIDGKSILLNSVNKKGLYVLKNIGNIYFKYLIRAANVCPVKIIKIVKN